jgi:hypothetical protein
MEGRLLKMIGVGGAKRSRFRRGVPAIAADRAGLRSGVVVWVAPAGPHAAHHRGEDQKGGAGAVRRSEFKQTFLDRYLFQPIAGSPDELMTFVSPRSQARIIQDAKIKVE